MLPFNETKKRKRPERLNMRQKQWLCEQKKSEPTITEKSLALLFYEKFKVSLQKRSILWENDDEEETVELVPLEEEPFIENEPILIDDERPMKKIKQEKITSFFLKK